MTRSIVFAAFTIIALFSVPISKAQEKQFDISKNTTYSVYEDGSTRVVQEVTIENKTEYYFTPSYTVKTGVSKITNIKAYNSSGTIPATVSTQSDDSQSITLEFEERYAGLNNENKFVIEYTTADIAEKRGNIWEVTVPGIENINQFDSYQIEIDVPQSFGDASIIKPNKDSKSLVFTKNEIGRSGVYVIFGDKQYFKYELSYNISNPNLFPVQTEIALPPGTNYQNVVVSSLSEKPSNVRRDQDGNWIAEYKLSPQEKKTIKATGYIEVLSMPAKVELNDKQRKDYTKESKFWHASDPEIQKIAKSLTSPKEIYDFVREKLSYNKSKVSTGAVRLGGKGVLDDPKNSVCLEFTDLFISIARAKGIPARAVEGFAYTDNSGFRPLSLVGDILHAWPEYYDNERKTWVMVDPTWEKTTQGMDYFNTLDLSHVAFAVKGVDSEYPIPAGGYKFSSESNDVKVTFAKPADFKKNIKISVEEDFPDRLLPKFTAKGTIKIVNSGNFPQENIEVGVATNQGTKRSYTIDYLPPFGYRQINASFTDTPVLTNEDYVITIQVGSEKFTKSIKISFIPDLTTILVIGGIISVSTITAAVTFHTGSLLVQRRKRKNSIRRKS